LYDQAERCYAVAEQLSGFAWRWTYYRALAQGARGDADGLAAGLRRVVAAAPEFSPAWWQLGEMEFKAGRDDRADEAWRRVLALPEPARPAPSAGSPARLAVAPISAYAILGLSRLAMAQGHADRGRPRRRLRGLVRHSGCSVVRMLHWVAQTRQRGQFGWPTVPPPTTPLSIR